MPSNVKKLANEVVIVDDEPQTLKMLSEFVEMIGYKPRTFNNGSEFLDSIESVRPNCIVLLDLNMPVIDGLEVIRKLSELKVSQTIVLLSGYDSGVLHSAEQLAKAHNLKILASLPKPIQFNSLEKVLQQQHNGNEVIELDETNVSLLDLKSGIKNNELKIYYQPQLNVATSQVVGVEALIKWHHNKYGVIEPNKFIKVAEQYDLMEEITDYVLKHSLKEMKDWNDQGLNLEISINISANNVKQKSLPMQIDDLVKTYGISPKNVTLEVTETALMQELIPSLENLTRIRMQGINLSIDDFGTGYSSLSHLYKIPFNELKIDKSFVMDIVNDNEALGIVKMCINLGHELDMKVVAEGVENKETYELLKSLNCDMAQGYYFTRPLISEDFLQWLKDSPNCSV